MISYVKKEAPYTINGVFSACKIQRQLLYTKNISNFVVERFLAYIADGVWQRKTGLLTILV